MGFFTCGIGSGSVKEFSSGGLRRGAAPAEVVPTPCELRRRPIPRTDVDSIGAARMTVSNPQILSIFGQISGQVILKRLTLS
jgi:hypothetical protein